ncbi:MAG: SDR family oxidoreductase [Nitrospirae bacterium]|nr:SDR family oxidoreductase [Nitrospirota bacterium]
MRWTFKDRVVVITGASAGIGRATALAFAREGAKLGLIARTSSALEEVQSEVQKAGSIAYVARADVTRPREVEQAVDSITRAFKTIDVLVNNAGYGVYGYLLSAPIEEHREMLETNLFGVLNMIYAVAPIMKSKKSGMIINISSMAGLRPIPKFATYSASKAALNALSDALRSELKPYGIHVMAVCPGITSTDFQKSAKRFGKNADLRRPSPRLSNTPDEVARAVVEGASGAERLVIPGMMNKLGAGLDWLAPSGLTERLMDRFLRIKAE